MAEVIEVNKVSICNSVRLLWVPGHCGVPGNETVDGLAKKASSTAFIGPEPVFGVPMCLMSTGPRGHTASNSDCGQKTPHADRPRCS